jgi:Flp pilus assembly CpaF family ATPase
MENRRLSKDFTLPNYLSEEQREEIILAIKKGIPIIISGEQGPTGKTTLVNTLRENGITAYEKWECLEIELNDRLD